MSNHRQAEEISRQKLNVWGGFKVQESMGVYFGGGRAKRYKKGGRKSTRRKRQLSEVKIIRGV